MTLGKNNTDKVSIIIPVFNAEDTIKESLDSVINGTYNNFEILVIDDCSTDNTKTIVLRMAAGDPRIKYYRNEQNLGAYKSRNIMLKEASGKYVAFLDSDDTWEPNKLEFCLQMLADNHHVKAVGHALRYLDKRGNKVSYIPTYPTTEEELKAVQEQGELSWVFPTALVVERETILQEGGFLEWRVGADNELISRIAQKHGLLAAKAPLGNYRVRGNSLTDKYWLVKRLTAECVKENQKRRVKGQPELTYEEYEEKFFNGLPPLQKFNKLREIQATRYMRKAGQAWLNREILPTLIYGVITTLLNPQATLHKVKWMKHYEKSIKDSK